MKKETNWLELYDDMFSTTILYPRFATPEQMDKFEKALEYCVKHKKKFNPKEWGFGQEDENFRI